MRIFQKPAPTPAHVVSVKKRNLKTDGIPPRGGVEDFDKPESFELNRARLAHLESLGLPIEGKSVLDLGCGVGHLAHLFVAKGCKVVSVDPRPENIARLRQLYPGLEAHVANVETVQEFGKFHIVFAYGLLYHLENPLIAFGNMASICQGILLIETMICDSLLPIVRLDDETLSFTQALHGLGCRPSPTYIVLHLCSEIPPNHRDFHFEWKNNCDWKRSAHLYRCMFVASKTKIKNLHLAELI